MPWNVETVDPMANGFGSPPSPGNKQTGVPNFGGAAATMELSKRDKSIQRNGSWRATYSRGMSNTTIDRSYLDLDTRQQYIEHIGETRTAFGFCSETNMT